MANPLDQLDSGGGPAIDVGAILRVLRKRAWLIVALLVVIPTLVGVYVSKEPKIYEATATLEISASAPQYLGQGFKDAVEVGGDWWSQQETLQTEMQRLHSHSLAVAVAQALCEKKVTIGGQQVTGLDAAFGAKSCDKAIIENMASGLSGFALAPIKDSRIVQVSTQHFDPDVAALLVNTFTQVYVERNLARRQTESEGAATWLGDEYGDLSQQLNDAEHALIDFKKKNNVVAVELEDQQNELSGRRKKLADELGTVQVRLIAVRALRAQYDKLQSNDPLTNVTPGIADSPVMLKMKELYVDQYAKLLELKGKYLEKHPTIIAQQARVDAIRADMVREAGLAGKTVEAQYDGLGRQEKDLRSALDGATHEALMLEQKGIEYSKLKRQLDHLVKISEQVGGREREQSLAGHLKTNNINIVDPALVPTAAIAPNVPRAIGVAFAIALLLGVGMSFAIEFMDTTVKTQEDVERAVGAAFLGLIPSITMDSGKKGDKGAASAVPAPPGLVDLVKAGSTDLWVLTHPKSAIAECCRAIRTNLLFMTPDKPAKSLLITSAGPQEGKSTTAINLAVTLAQSGLKVLLVDTDMRRPRLHKAFGIPSNADGLSRAIVGETDVMKCIRETGVPNLSLLPCGACPPNPAELLHAERFIKIEETLTANFDRVIFDSPPIGLVTDAAILARTVDGTIIVAKGGFTSKDALQRARRQLSGEGTNILGAILNDLDLSRPGGYAYQYYYSKYGYYYGEGDAKGAGG